MTILVSGVGNALKGDDGFGVRAAQVLKDDPRLPDDVTVMETGIGGIHMVQELMRGYSALIVLDAYDRKAEPGRLFVLEPQLPDISALSEKEHRDFFADIHYATPVRALTFAREVGALPEIVRIVGCQPHDPDAFGTEMHMAVKAAIPQAVDMVLEIIDAIHANKPAGKAPA